MSVKRILLLSAYHAHSHQYWLSQLVNHFPQYHWQNLTLKDRNFAWRMGGNALNFKASYDEALMEDYDLLMATSMSDLSTIRGLYPHLAQIPNVLYFHENQFAYPKNKRQQGLAEIQIRSIYSALSADQLVFNSAYNRSSFIHGITNFLTQMPDGIPKDIISNLEVKSSTLAVPIQADCIPNPNRKQTVKKELHVVWNHRWEHDKGPETLLRVLQKCRNKAIKFHILGQQFRKMPAAMSEVIQHHQNQCLNLGFIKSRRRYIETLQSADAVISTAHHEFQGLAMLEAVACGCLPIAPNRLVYPELYPDTNLYPSSPSSPEKEADAVVDLLGRYQQLQPAKITCHWPQLQQQYANILQVCP